MVWNSAHVKATCRGSRLGLVSRCGSFGGLMAVGKDNFLSDGIGEPAGRNGEKSFQNTLLYDDDAILFCHLNRKGLCIFFWYSMIVGHGLWYWSIPIEMSADILNKMTQDDGNGTHDVDQGDYLLVNVTDSPSRCLWSGREDPRLNRKNGLRSTFGGRLGFKGRAPSGGRGLLNGVTSSEVFDRGCSRGEGERAAAGLRAGDAGWFVPGSRGLVPGGLSIKFCSISPVCLTLLASAGWSWSPGLSPGLGGNRGKETGLAGMDGIIGSSFESLTSRAAVGGERARGDSLWWARLLLPTGSIALPNPGCEGWMLVSEVSALLVNMAFRALTSTCSSWQQAQVQQQLGLKQETSSAARHAPAHRCNPLRKALHGENASCKKKGFLFPLSLSLQASQLKTCAVYIKAHLGKQNSLTTGRFCAFAAQQQWHLKFDWHH